MSNCDDIECTCDDNSGWVRPPGYRILPSDIVFTALGFVAKVFEAASGAFDELQDAAGRHINYRREQEEFMATAGLELETLMETMDMPAPPQEDK